MSVILSFLSLLFCLTLLTAYSVSTRVTPQNGLRSASQALKYEDRGAEFLSPHELPESQPPSAETNQQVPHHPACFLDEDNVMRCNQCKKMTYSYIYASEVSQDDTCRSTDEGPPPRELRPPLTLKWRTGKDMPIEMGTLVQSVVIGDTMYVGGGFADDYRDQCTVMKLEQDQWTKLPEYTAELFAMTSLANQLVLVGGRDPRNHTRSNQQLAVFKSGEWTHPYPPMNIARSYSTAVSFNNHIIVAGGDDDGEPTSSVEVLDVASRRWYSAQSLPNPKSTLQSTLIGNTLYLMDHTAGATKTVHHVDLNELIAKALSNLDTPTLWQIIEDTPLTWSAPLSIGRSLLAIGGLQDDGVNPSSSIHLYQPDTRRWVKVEDLPTARHSCTCSVLPSGEVIVAGGLNHNHAELGYLNTVDIFSINS